MTTRTLIRLLLALLALGALLVGIVLSRAIPGLPPRVPVIIDAPSPAEPVLVEPAATPVPIAADDEIGSVDLAVVEILPPTAPEQGGVPFFPELRNEALRVQLRNIASAGHDEDRLNYRRAREVLYWILDNEQGTVTTVYALRELPLANGQWPRQQDLNCEHIWPQSKGAKALPMKADLFHLRPAVPRVNSIRSNHPFGEPVTKDDPSTPWHVGRDAAGQTVFQPPPEHQGDISRSMFYFAVRYDESIDEGQEAVLRAWHQRDPVDARERARADAIEHEQGNRNPFIDDPDAVRRIEDF
jgi:deoxyribonuclease-1